MCGLDNKIRRPSLNKLQLPFSLYVFYFICETQKLFRSQTNFGVDWQT